jgi:hypothetical protein
MSDQDVARFSGVAGVSVWGIGAAARQPFDPVPGGRGARSPAAPS